MITINVVLALLTIVLCINWMDVGLDYISLRYDHFMDENAWRIYPLGACTVVIIMVILGVTFI